MALRGVAIDEDLEGRAVVESEGEIWMVLTAHDSSESLANDDLWIEANG